MKKYKNIQRFVISGVFLSIQMVFLINILASSIVAFLNGGRFIDFSILYLFLFLCAFFLAKCFVSSGCLLEEYLKLKPCIRLLKGLGRDARFGLIWYGVFLLCLISFQEYYLEMSLIWSYYVWQILFSSLVVFILVFISLERITFLQETKLSENTDASYDTNEGSFVFKSDEENILVYVRFLYICGDPEVMEAFKKLVLREDKEVS